jgi:hypothetical protein
MTLYIYRENYINGKYKTMLVCSVAIIISLTIMMLSLIAISLEKSKLKKQYSV